MVLDLNVPSPSPESADNLCFSGSESFSFVFSFVIALILLPSDFTSCEKKDSVQVFEAQQSMIVVKKHL